MLFQRKMDWRKSECLSALHNCLMLQSATPVSRPFSLGTQPPLCSVLNAARASRMSIWILNRWSGIQFIFCLLFFSSVVWPAALHTNSAARLSSLIKMAPWIDYVMCTRYKLNKNTWSTRFYLLSRSKFLALVLPLLLLLFYFFTSNSKHERLRTIVINNREHREQS